MLSFAGGGRVGGVTPGYESILIQFSYRGKCILDIHICGGMD